MSDIFGRSTITPTDVITKKQISSMIRNYVTSRLNLVDVDPGEIVVFGDKQGKLKTSNLSLDDLLTKQPAADDDSIVVFKSGKLAPSYNIKTLDKIVEIETDLETYMKDYKQFRKNVITKFFGTPLVVTPSLAEIKKSIEDIKTITDKVKIPHDATVVKGISCVVFQELDLEYINPNPKLVLIHKMTIAGIYRFTVFSEHQFNIHIINGFIQQIEQIAHKGTNTVLFLYDLKKDYFATVKPVDSTVVRAKFGCILEYVSAI